MRLTKRAYAFLCRQYRLILQQNHLANAVCRGLVAGAVGVTLASGVAHAESLANGQISAPVNGDAYTVEVASGGNYLTTFTTKNADGTEVTYGISLNEESTIAGAAKDALTGYTIDYNETTKKFTVKQGESEITSHNITTNGNSYTGKQIGQLKEDNGSYNTVYIAENGWFLHSSLSNYTENATVEADFVNNTVANNLPNYPRSAGGALYNGIQDDNREATASITKITGDFIGNISECDRSDAMYGYGGAIANMGYSGWTAEIGDIEGDFIGNTASGSGGAIYANGSSGTSTIGDITGDFIGNTAVVGEGGAIVVDDTTVGTITGNFIDNTANSRGGAIHIRDDTSVGAITGDFVGNTSLADGGGAIYNERTISGTETGGVYGDAITGDFVANKAKLHGGAIHNYGTINGNIVGDFYGNESTAGNGGAIYNSEINGAGTINGNIEGNFYSNKAALSGGAIHSGTGTTVGDITGDFSSNVATSGSGGAIYSNGQTGSIEGDFVANSAGTSGGAMFLSGVNAKKAIDHVTGDFKDNTARTSGGAVHSGTNITNFTGDFTNNSVANGESVSPTRIPSEGFGGALYNSGDIGTLKSSFTNNSVTNTSKSSKTGSYATSNSYALGGALYNTGDIGALQGKDDVDGALSGNTVVNSSTNTTKYQSDIYAYAEGGAIYSEGTIGDINEDFTNNSATNSSTNTVGNRCELTTTAKGGAIYSNNKLGDITGDFTNNKAENKSQNTASYKNYSYPILETTASGGAIHTTGAVGAIKGNFSGNQAVNTSTWNGLRSETVEALGGAIYNTGTMTTIDGSFTDNKATSTGDAFVDSFGGAIYNDGTITTLNASADGFKNNTIEVNGLISDGAGGALYNTGSVTTSITGDFENNTIKSTGSSNYYEATAYGGAIYNTKTIGDIEGDFSKNTVTSTGANYNSNTESRGGAIYNTKNIGKITGNFTDNSAKSVGGTSAYTSKSNGGAIYNTGTIASIEGDFFGNTTTIANTNLSSSSVESNGGAIYNKAFSYYDTATINSIIGNFTNNSAGENGGAIYNEGTLTGIKSDFIGNTAGSQGGAIYTTESIAFTADTGEDFEFTDNMAGGNYNAIYIKGDYSLNTPTTISFDMNGDGAFTVNESILGENVFTVAITGDNKSTFIMNDNITAKQQYIYSPRSSVDLNDVTLELGSAHNGATDGSIYVDKLNVNGNTDIDMLGDGNTIEVLSTNIASNTELNIDAGAIAANSKGNVKTGTLTMSTGSALNLTGDTFMTASGNTVINSATVNVGNDTAGDAKLHLATTTATDSTIKVIDSEFKAGNTTLTNTDFTATTSTAEFGNLTSSENTIAVSGDGSKLTAKTTKLTNTKLSVTDGDGASFGDLTATGESITITNGDITAGNTTLTGTRLSATDGQNAIFGDLSATDESITISNATFTAGKTMMDGTDLTVTSAHSVTMDSLTASNNIMNFGASTSTAPATPTALTVAGHVNLDASTTTISNATGTFGTKQPNWNDPKDFVTLTNASALSINENSNITMQEFSASDASSLSVNASTVNMNTLTANVGTTLTVEDSTFKATTTKLNKTQLTITDSKSNFSWFETSNESTITVSGTKAADVDSINVSSEMRLTDSTMSLTDGAKGHFNNAMDLTRSQLTVDSGASAYIKESLLGDGSTVTIDGTALTVQEYYSTAVEFTNSTLTLENGATGSFLHTYGYKTGVMEIADNSAFNVESDSKVELGNVSAANGSSVLIDGANSSITGIGSYYANEFEDSSLTVSNGATANFSGDIELDSGILSVSGGSTIAMDMLSGKNDSEITVDGAGTSLTSTWVQSGYSSYNTPKLNNTSLTFTDGATGTFAGRLDLTNSPVMISGGSDLTASTGLMSYGKDKNSITVTDAGSTLIANGYSTLSGATMTVDKQADATFETLRGYSDSNIIVADAGSSITATKELTLSATALTVKDEATLTAGKGTFTASPLTIENQAMASFDDKLEFKGSEVSVTGASRLTSTSTETVAFNISTWPAATGFLKVDGASTATFGGDGTTYTEDTIKNNLGGGGSFNSTDVSVSGGSTVTFGNAFTHEHDTRPLATVTHYTGALDFSNGSDLLVTGAGSNFHGGKLSMASGKLTIEDTASADFYGDADFTDSHVSIAGKAGAATNTTASFCGDETFNNSDVTVTDGAMATFGSAFTHEHDPVEHEMFTHYQGTLDFSNGSDLLVTGAGSTFYAGRLSMENGELSIEDTATADFYGDAAFTNSPVSVKGASRASVCGDASFTNSDVTVTGGSTAIFGKYHYHKHKTTAGADMTIVDHYDGELKFVNSDLTVTGNGTTFYAGSASMDHGTLTMSEGVKVNMGGSGEDFLNGGFYFSNGGAIKVISGETGQEDNLSGDNRASTVAALNLHGNLVLDNSSIEVANGSDLTIYFYNDGNTISGVEGSINTINVSGEGSTLHVSLQNGKAEDSNYFEDIILNITNDAIFEVDGLEFNFTGGASADEVVNLSVSDGAHAVFDKLAIETADIDVTNSGGKASAFVAEQLTFVDSTFTVSQSYAQVNSLLSAEPSGSSGGTGTTGTGGGISTPSSSPASSMASRAMMGPMSGPMMSTMMRAGSSAFTYTTAEDSYLGNGTITSSDLRIAAGGVFVLGEVGTNATEKEQTAKELLLGLEATNAESAGAAGAATGSYDALTQGSSDSYGITLDPNHSAFAMTGGERLIINKGSSLIIDADAASKIEGGANKYLLDNVPLYIGHDDILLIDNIDKKYNVLEGQPQGVITIADSGLDTAYILSADSKIRVIVDNDTAAEGTFAVIYDKNHADDDAHDPSDPAKKYKGDIYFTLGDATNLGDKNANKFDVCGHVNQGGAGYIDDNRITTKTYDTIIMQNVDSNDANAATIPAGKPYVDDEDDEYTVYEFKMGIEDYKPNFGVEDELYASLVDVYKAKDSSLQAADDATRFLTKTTVYATEKHDRDAVIKLGSVTEIAVVGGVANMAHDAMTTATDALGRYLDYGINATGAYDEKGSFSLWGIPLYSQSKVDGIEVGSIEGGYEQELIAGIMGVDISNNSGRIGVSFTAGMGESSSTKDFLQTENDTTFYGGGLYGQYKFGSFAVRADLGYYMTEGSLEQESCDYSDFGKVTADVDATIMTAGFDASYLFSFNERWALKPHAGVRYSLYSQDEFTSEVNGNDFFITKDADMSIISVPLGVSLLTNFGIGDWIFQPRLDASIIFNFGDTSVENNVTTPNLKSFGTANIDADILDEYTLSGSVGIDANYGNFTIGLDYNMQQSERRTAYGIFGTIRYEF